MLPPLHLASGDVLHGGVMIAYGKYLILPVSADWLHPPYQMNYLIGRFLTPPIAADIMNRDPSSFCSCSTICTAVPAKNERELNHLPVLTGTVTLEGFVTSRVLPRWLQVNTKCTREL